jgi:hypothetical protein
MRVVGTVAWALALAASLVFLWFGVYRVMSPTQTESTLCGGVDLPWFVAGVLLNLVAAAIAFGTLRARWWTLGIALPALAGVVVQLLLPCSFVLPLVLPAAALVSVASAVVVVVRPLLR